MLPFKIHGHTVEYHEHSALWVWRDDEGTEIFKDSQLRPVREAIDKHEAKMARQAKEKFTEWEAVLVDWNGMKRVTVISQADDAHVWVRHKDKRRSKERLSELKKFDECAGAFEEYESNLLKAEILRARREQIQKTLFPRQ